MAFTNMQAVILAAGRSSRFKTGKTKLIEKICGREMIAYPATLLHTLNVPLSVVVGFQKEYVENALRVHITTNLKFVEQTEQLGTGHALSCSKPTWTKDLILVMNGDMPLVTQEIIEELYVQHNTNKAAISFVTAHNCEPTAAGYGRIVQTDSSISIVEAKEFSGDATENCCINAGIYLINRSFLETHLEQLQKSSVTGEWYITDLIKIASDNKLGVHMMSAPFDRIRGVNTFKELWAVEQIQKAEIIKYWMDQGVRFRNPQNVQIDRDVTIERGSFIDSGVHLLGKTSIGKDCTLGAFSIITDSTLGNGTSILSHTVIDQASLDSNIQVGPFAHVHGKSHIHDNVIIGNFVEVKRSTLGASTKAKHLTYLGDATLGKEVNIGAGTIVCNYNGVEKFKTIIEDNAFVGSNNTLIAPLLIEKNAFTAAGSTITDTVPEDALAIARTRQENKDGYAKKLKRQDETILDLQEEQTCLGATKSKSFETNL